MRSYRPIPLLAFALLATACGESALPTSAGDQSQPKVQTAAPASPGAAAKREALARRFARAMADPEFRRLVKESFDRSTIREHKLHFQRFAAGENKRVARAIARANAESDDAVAADVEAAAPLEVYLPVPAHRAAWQGGADVLVATAEKDGDAPIAFDTEGRRVVLDPAKPPAQPVIALVPVETDFDRPARLAGAECLDCGGSGGGGGVAPEPGLYMTASHLNQLYEGWLKGAPEIEVLILGRKGNTDSLTSYQCIGERSLAPFNFNQDRNDWAGNVMLFSQQQLDAYKVQQPDQGFRIFFNEDDDTACKLKNNDLPELLRQVDSFTRGLAGARDKKTLVEKIITYIKIFPRWLSAVGAIINTSDDLIGNAVDDEIAVEFHAGYNWIIRSTGNTTTGWINLEMK